MITTGALVPAPAADPPAGAVASRYRLVRLLPRQGAQGEVWLADDEVFPDRPAVVKFLGRECRTAHQEIAVLRFAQLPGVVPVRDEGIGSHGRYLVMDYLDGHVPFDAAGGPLLTRIRALLAVLARVHALGIAHRDLKPGNVLVSAEGRVALLDFGLGGPSPDRRTACTVGFAAPEQLTGRGGGRSADLYAVGAMIGVCGTGRIPFWRDDDDVVAMTASRAYAKRASTIGELAGIGEPLLGLAVDLLDPDPDARPTVWEALERVGGDALELPFELRSRFDQQAMRKLFAGPDRFQHLRRDAAAALWERTGGHPAPMQAELTAWIRAGLATVDGRVVRVGRRALDRLRSGLRVRPALADPADESLRVLRMLAPFATDHLFADAMAFPLEDARLQLAQLAADGGAWRALDGRWCSAVRAGEGIHTEIAVRRRVLARAGRGLSTAADRVRLALNLGLPPAEPVASLLDEVATSLQTAERAKSGPALDLVHAVGGPEERAQALELAVAGAILAESLDGLLAARHRVLTDGQHPRMLDLDDLLLAAQRARIDREPAEARQLLAGLGTFDTPCLAWVHRIVEVWSLSDRSCAQEDRLVALARWSRGSPHLEAQRLRLVGLKRYDQGRFDAAARLHRAARALAECPVTDALNLASALLEAGRCEEVVGLARAAAAAAAQRREPSNEAFATWLERSARYRCGLDPSPRVDLVDAAVPLGPEKLGPFALTEAAVAWRAGDLALGRRLAGRAEHAYRQRARRVVAGLAMALGVACGAPWGPREFEVTAHDALVLPALRLQALALLALGRCRVTGDLAPLWHAVRGMDHSLRRDVLSLREARHVLEG
ncbi:MAG: hypothetical protein ACI9K2_004770 [Myxococcota bacterium]